MKNLLLTLFTVLLASASFSQLDLEAKLVTPTTDTVRAVGVDFTLRIINRGTVAITATDTVNFEITLNGGYWTGYYSVASVIAVGDSITFNEIKNNFASQPSTQTYHTMCVVVSAEVALGVDSDLTNNSDCFVLERSLVGVDELSINEEVTISAVYGVINMTSLNEENYSYSVYSMAGQVISQGSFVNNKEVDMTGAAKGIYAVVVSNETEKITKKISIQ